MRNFQYHLFNPYAVNEEGLQEFFEIFKKKPKEPPSTIAERRQHELRSNYPDEGYISPFGHDGPISKEIIEAQKKRAEKEREILKQIAGPNATIEPQSKNPIPPRIVKSQPSNIQPPKINNPTNKITSIPISFTPPTFRLPAAVSKPPPSFNSTSDKLKDIIDKLKQQQKGVKIGEMNQYSPYLFHSPLLEYNDEYFNEGWVEKIKESLKKLAGKAPEAANRMGQTARNIDQGAGKNNPHDSVLRTMEKARIGSKAAGRVDSTYAHQRLPRELTGLGQRQQGIAYYMNTARVPYSQAAAMKRTADHQKMMANQNPPNNSGNKFYSNHIRRESTDISQYSPYLFHSPLLEDFYFTENHIGDSIDYPLYTGLE